MALMGIMVVGWGVGGTCMIALSFMLCTMLT
jgi:hypothetical protein